MILYIHLNTGLAKFGMFLEIPIVWMTWRESNGPLTPSMKFCQSSTLNSDPSIQLRCWIKWEPRYVYFLELNLFFLQKSWRRYFFLFFMLHFQIYNIGNRKHYCKYLTLTPAKPPPLCFNMLLYRKYISCFCGVLQHRMESCYRGWKLTCCH